MDSLNHILKHKVKYGIAFIIITAVVLIVNFYLRTNYYTYEYYPTGEKLKEYHLKDSLLEGRIYEYYKSGIIKSSEYYENGCKTDSSYYFDTQGKLLYKLYYEKGVLKDSVAINWNK